MGNVRAALIDIDGTLIDSNELHVMAWQEALAGLGHAVTPQAIRALIGMGGDKLVPTLWPDADEALVREADHRHGAIFKGSYLGRARPFPKASELVARIHDAGLRAVLATSASAEEVDHYVELLGIAPFLATTTSVDEVEQSKPSPDIFATALGKAGVAPDAALAIGDSPFDVQGAARSGVGTVALLSGNFDRTVLVDAGAIAIYADPADLLARFASSPLAGAGTGGPAAAREMRT